MNKQHIFLVTGYPRSRTAWFANLLTWGNSHCLHDPLRNCATFEEGASTVDRLLAIGYAAVGIADPASILFWRNLNMRFPTAKWVVVHRPFEEALASARRIHPEVSRQAFEMYEYCLEQLRRNLRPMIVDFHNIDLSTAYAVSRYVNADIGPRERVTQCCRMNVQVDREQLQRELKQLETEPPAWLKEEAMVAAT